MIAAGIARRWRPPDKDGPGQHPLKVPPGPNQKLPPESAATIQETGAFATAVDLRQRGLYPIPLGGPEHRTPLVKGFTKNRAMPVEAIERLIKRHPIASLGLVTGWLILVVDIDSGDPAILRLVEERFGEAVIRIRTPRGGWHLYYRFAGERCRNLRREGLPVDVKARGGFVVAPPSVRQSGENVGKAYTFERGSWDDLRRLKAIKSGSLAPRVVLSSDHPAPPAAALRPQPVHQLGADTHYRNIMLFRSAMIRAPSWSSEKALLDAGIEINAKFNPPLDTDEVVKTVRSAWGYEERGENRLGRSSDLIRAASVTAALAAHPDAATLYPVLKHANAARDARGERFAASPAAMARDRVIPAWGNAPRRYRRALVVLVELLGLLVVVHRGGRCRGDARKFRFGKGAIMKPQLVVSNDDNQDFLLVVDLLKRDAAIRDIAQALNKSKSQVHRLKQRAVALGLLGKLVRDRAPKLAVVPSSAEGGPLSEGRGGHGGAGVESLTLTTSFGTKPEDRDKAVVKALNSGASIRQIATAFGLAKSKVLRLKHRAAAAGLLHVRREFAYRTGRFPAGLSRLPAARVSPEPGPEADGIEDVAIAIYETHLTRNARSWAAASPEVRDYVRAQAENAVSAWLRMKPVPQAIR
jgi:hypothetical protein